MGNENLIPLMDRTPEERQEIARKGGKAKAERAKQRKAIADTFNEILSLRYDENTTNEYKLEHHYGYGGVLADRDFWINLEGQTILTRLCAGIVKEALKGDMRASALIFKYIAPDD